jgi:hypothetical protein
MRQHLESSHKVSQDCDDAVEIGQRLFFVTITDNLEQWELDVGLNPDTTLPISVRRGKVVGRLRSTPNSTISKVADVVNAYLEIGYAHVYQIEPFGVMVEIMGETPSPDVVIIIKTSVAEMLPAHLVLNLGTTYPSTDNEYFVASPITKYAHYTLNMEEYV